MIGARAGRADSLSGGEGVAEDRLCAATGTAETAARALTKRPRRRYPSLKGAVVVAGGEGDIHAGGGLSVRQRLEGGIVQVTVTRELDLATAPQLENRLRDKPHAGRTRSPTARVHLRGRARSVARVLAAPGAYSSRVLRCHDRAASVRARRSSVAGRGGRTHPGNCAPTSPVGLVARKDPGRRATPGRPTGR
jgi:hypothetical protein